MGSDSLLGLSGYWILTCIGIVTDFSCISVGVSGLPAQVPQLFPMLGEFLGASFAAGLYCLFDLGAYKQFVKMDVGPNLS